MMTNVFTSLFLTFLLSFYSVPSIASGGGVTVSLKLEILTYTRLHPGRGLIMSL